MTELHIVMFRTSDTKFEILRLRDAERAEACAVMLREKYPGAEVLVGHEVSEQ